MGYTIKPLTARESHMAAHRKRNLLLIEKTTATFNLIWDLCIG